MTDAKLLSDPTNYAVVQLPGRAYPGIVFQGDSLHALIADLERASAEGNPAEMLTDVIDHLREVQARYEAVLKREGMALPYSRA